MLKTVKRLAAVCLAAVIAMGFVPALNAEAATLKKPENCRFVKWLENDDFDDCTIKWNKVSGTDGYQTVLTWTDGSHAKWNNVSKSKDSINYYNIDDDHVWMVKVRAYKNTAKGKQYGAWSNLAFITPSPDDYKLKNVSPNSSNLQERITWDIVKGCSGYNIFVTTNPRGTWVWNQSTATKATATSAVISKYRGAMLKKHTTYYFRVVTRRIRNGVFCSVPMPSASYYTGTFRFN